jgi:hypothetical protein
MNTRNVVIGLILAALAAAVVVSCGGGGGGGSNPPAPAANVVRSASLDGTQAGLTGITGTGLGAVVFNPNTMEITGGINFTGLTGAPTGGAHIHDQAASDAIIIGLDIAPDNAVATIPAGSSLTPTQQAHLVAGQLYFQVHTTAHGAGEIRGQITGATGLVANVSTLNGAQEVPVAAVSTTGKGTVVVDSSTMNVLIGYVTHNVTTADKAHIHCATGPGTNGPIVVGFNVNAGTGISTAPQGAAFLPGDYSALIINYCYFNVHSTTDGYPGGEIRADIAAQIIP